MKENVPITDPVWMVDPNWMSKTGGYAKDMTLRDHYAGLAMQGMIANNGTNAEVLVRVAYKMADAMLAARDGK